METNQPETEIPLEISLIIENLVTSTQKEKILQSSNDLKAFIIANKAGLLFLEAEFDKIFGKITDFDKFLLNFNMILEVWHSMKLFNLPYKAISRSFFKIFKIHEKIQSSEASKKLIENFMISNWKLLNIDSLKDFFFGLDLEIVPKNEKISFIQEKCQNNFYSDASKLINFFNLFDDFDRKILAQSIIALAKAKKDKGLYESLFRLIKDHPTVDDLLFINFSVILLCTNETVTFSAKLIKKYKLDIKAYPEVLERMKKKALRYTLWEKGWFGCEERFCLYEDILGYLAEELFHKGKYQESWSIIQRYDLLKKGLIKKIEPINYFKENQQYVVLPNPIFQKDSFNPIEENIEQVLPGYHINLRDFGINEQDVYYIDDLNHEDFKLAQKELENSKIIGLDSEFIMTSNSFEQQGISIFQISNDKKGFIFDMEKISHLPAFQTFFFDLLANKNIAKIGHTISSDIKMLKKNASLELDKKGSLINYVELPTLFKALKPGGKFTSLKHIAETILNKPMSKGDQCSNWSKKPLRKSQLHYGALDAVICVMIYKEMVKLCEEAKINPLNFHTDIFLGDPNLNLNENNSEGGENHSNSDDLEEEKKEEITQNEKKGKNSHGGKNKKQKNPKEEKKKKEISPNKEKITENTTKNVESLFGDDDY